MSHLPVQFTFDREGLIESVRDAANPAYPKWSAYYGDAIGRAVWQAKYVLRRARTLGIYPSTAQLEAECRKAA